MDLQAALQRREQVEEFRRKHKTALLTLVFTDTVGSTRLKQELGDAEAVSLIQRHHALVRKILGCFKDAEEISTAGDSFFVVFLKPSDAVRFALLVQAGLRVFSGATGLAITDRIGLHIGEVLVEETATAAEPKHLYGMQVDSCSRVMSLAKGDQILMTRSVFDNARQVLKGQDAQELAPLAWMNHGPYLLAGMDEPLEVCEVGETGKAVLKAPSDTDKAHHHISPDAEPVLGWRPALEQVIPGSKWVLERKLGEGGFGEVWIGRHESLKHHRIFKFCFRADRVRSLKREVTIFRLLKEKIGHHPNIVGVQEVCFDQPPYYIMMDFSEGKDLKSWCEDRGGVATVPSEMCFEIIAQVADALQAAHDAGVIHRDVKPANIIVCEQGAKLNVKLTDFGIGQVVSQEVLAGITRGGFTQTRMGGSSSSHSGTQMYMAPELLAGKNATAQSDIYSLGVVLYQLVTGDLSRPLTTDWVDEISDPVLREDLRKCFAGNPQQRFANAGQLAQQLRSLSRRQAERADQQASREARQRSKRTLVRTVVLGALLLAVGGSIWYWDAYYRVHVSYFANAVTRWGVLEGIGPLTVRQVSRRVSSYKFCRRGRIGKVTRVDLVNGSGFTPVYHDAGALTVGLQGSDTGRSEAIWRFEYDSNNQLKIEIVTDRHDYLVAKFDYTNVSKAGREALAMSMSETGLTSPRAASGAAAMRIRRSEDGFDDWIQYVDAAGNPRSDKDGIFGKSIRHDARGSVTELIYLNDADKPLRHPDGFAKVVKQYDETGNDIEGRYFDESGKPASVDGVATYTIKYDRDGNPVEWAAFDNSGKPTRNKYGIAKVVSNYDQHGNTAEWTVFDETGRPTRNKYGITRVVSKHDQHGNTIELAFIDETGKPSRNTNGIARVTNKYDHQDNLIEQAAFNETDKPTHQEDGAERFSIKYDERGNAIEQSFFDHTGKPTRITAGYAKVTSKYDERGNETDRAFFDENGQPVHTQVVIVDVQPGYQGQEVGLHSNDVILSYGGKAITTSVFSTQSPGESSRELKILRDGVVQTFTVKPGLLGIGCDDRVVPPPATTNAPPPPKP